MWLDPTVSVISAFSATIGGIGLVSTKIDSEVINLPIDIYFGGIPTCWVDFYGYWGPSLSEYLRRSSPGLF
jgi:hypothetical protein